MWIKIGMIMAAPAKLGAPYRSFVLRGNGSWEVCVAVAAPPPAIFASAESIKNLQISKRESNGDVRLVSAAMGTTKCSESVAWVLHGSGILHGACPERSRRALNDKETE
jgi:hypothetical protein